MIEALVFDLDDTLYPEQDFVLSGYRAVARFLADTGLCDPDTALHRMEQTYKEEGKLQVFPSMLELLPEAPIELTDLIDVYRQHMPAISLFPGYPNLLRALSRDYRLGVITDGLPAVQARKVRALGLENLIDRILYTWEYGVEKQKPHPYSFSLMLDYFHAAPEAALYVGDNPGKDCRGAHQAGMKFAQVRPVHADAPSSGGGSSEEPEFMIDSLFQLPQILRHLN